MEKARINLALDRDLLDFLKDYALLQRTTVSEVITQFALGLQRSKTDDPTALLLSDPAFAASLESAVRNIQAGTVKWKSCSEVFD